MKIKRILNNIFFAILITSMVSCKDDNIECLKCDDCENFPESKAWYRDVTIIANGKSPCFNPNNGNEFIYIKTSNNISSLVKYNMLDKKEYVLVEKDKFVGQPKWGKNGQIVYTNLNLKINVLRDDGKDLRTITGINFLYPDWKNDTVISSEFSFKLGVPYYYAELHISGKLIDTVRNRTFVWGAINGLGELAHILYSNQPNIIVNSNNNIKYLSKESSNGGNGVVGISWHPNNNDIYYTTNRDGLFKINKDSNKKTKIRNGCDSRSYKHLSISPDGTKIIVERMDAYNFDVNTGSSTEEFNIYIMDIDGSNERKVF